MSILLSDLRSLRFIIFLLTEPVYNSTVDTFIEYAKMSFPDLSDHLPYLLLSDEIDNIRKNMLKVTNFDDFQGCKIDKRIELLWR